MRPSPEPFSPEERLFRRVANDLVVDEVLIEAAIDAMEIPACSFNREKYSAPESVLVEAKPAERRIAYTTPASLPPPWSTEGGVQLRYEAVDLPEDFNEAHCEVHLLRGAETVPYKPKGKAKYDARLRLWKALRILPVI